MENKKKMTIEKGVEIFENSKNKIKELGLQKIIKIGLIILVLIIGISIYKNRSREVTSKSLNLLLEKSSEVTSAKLYITGFYSYEDDGISIINSSDFKMVYKATIRAGFNLSEVEVTKVTSDTVYVTVPKSNVLEVTIDNDKVEIFDSGFSLFNFNSKDDMNKALSLAKEDAKSNAEATGILEFADKYGEELIENLLSQNMDSKMEFVFEHK